MWAENAGDFPPLGAEPLATPDASFPGPEMRSHGGGGLNDRGGGEEPTFSQSLVQLDSLAGPRKRPLTGKSCSAAPELTAAESTSCATGVAGSGDFHGPLEPTFSQSLDQLDCLAGPKKRHQTQMAAAVPTPLARAPVLSQSFDHVDNLAEPQNTQWRQVTAAAPTMRAVPETTTVGGGGGGKEQMKTTHMVEGHGTLRPAYNIESSMAPPVSHPRDFSAMEASKINCSQSALAAGLELDADVAELLGT